MPELVLRVRQELDRCANDCSGFLHFDFLGTVLVSDYFVHILDTWLQSDWRVVTDLRVAHSFEVGVDLIEFRSFW